MIKMVKKNWKSVLLTLLVMITLQANYRFDNWIVESLVGLLCYWWIWILWLGYVTNKSNDSRSRL